MPPVYTPDQRDVIAARKHATTLHILVASPALTGLGDRAARTIPRPRATKTGSYGRPVARVPRDDASRFRPKGTSWCLAILVDPATPWPPLLAMGRSLGVEARTRTQFHLTDGLDPVALLEPWFPLDSLPAFASYSDERNLIKHLLEQLNNQNLRDYAGGDVPGL